VIGPQCCLAERRGAAYLRRALEALPSQIEDFLLPRCKGRHDVRDGMLRTEVFERLLRIGVKEVQVSESADM